MSKLNVSVCSETGMCSIMKSGTDKVDLMPNEWDEIKNAAGDIAKIRNIVSEADPTFAKNLSDEELANVVALGKEK